MRQFNVTGMSCAACSARVEKAVKALDGVSACSVSLLTNAMGVEGSASDEEIIRAVTGAGYGATRKGEGGEKASAPAEEELQDRESPVLKRRLLSSIGFLAVLMYFSMGHMLSLPMPGFFAHNPMANGLVQMLLAMIVMVINQKFFINGFKGLMHRAPNMDTLVALGSSASFAWSFYAMLRMSDAMLTGGASAAMAWKMELYFESAAMIVTLITVGKLLQARSKGKTTDALKSLMRLKPQTATLLRVDEQVVVPVSEIKPGDVFVLRPGEMIPVDGVVLSGTSAVNESALTGEAVPVDKQAGDTVSASTINQSGFIRCEARRVGEDTTISQIIRMVSDAAATKAPIARIADRVSGVFVPTVIAIAMITLVAWLIAGKDVGYALARGISVLVISCPCALGLATPVAIMVGSGVGAKNGMLFKTAEALENCGKTHIVVLDKTGTVTTGQMQVTDVVPAEGENENTLIHLAAALEQHSEHPLSGAIMRYAQQKQVKVDAVEGFQALPGNGLSAQYQGGELLGGSMKFISAKTSVPGDIRAAADRVSGEGKTPLLFMHAGRLLGLIAVADTVKPDSVQAVKEMKNLGLRVVMLTGDNEKTAKAIAAQVGVDEVIASVLPDGKEKEIRRLKHHGRVMMVGDGINDAPALTRADLGVAIGAGADVAIDSANVVLMHSRLTDAVAAIRLSRAVTRNIHENLFWAFFYNVCGIPLAAGVFISLFGWQMNPMFGAAAMSLSSFCVVSNALRLNLFNPFSAKSDRKIKPFKEDKTMEKTVRINGMMCPHCEGRMKKIFEALPQVDEAVTSHKDANAVLTLNAPITDEEIRKAVEEAGYEYVG